MAKLPTPDATAPKPLYDTVQTVCATHRISVPTFYRQIKLPGSPIRVVKVGRKTLVEVASMERWAASLPQLGQSTPQRTA